MSGYYFAKHEEISKGGVQMIIMDIKTDNLFALKKFHMNMSYPKKLVNPIIPKEHLEDKPNFRYKKVNIIMGGNAKGKTSLGKLLMLFANYFKDGDYNRFINIIDDKKKNAVLIIDFVTNQENLYRFDMNITTNESGNYRKNDVKIDIYYTPINKRDSYETCAKRIDEEDCPKISYNKINTSGWYFSYPLDAWKNKTYSAIEDDDRYL